MIADDESGEVMDCLVANVEKSGGVKTVEFLDLGLAS